MWNTKRSVVLSCICTKLVILISVLFLLSAPYWVNLYITYRFQYAEIKEELLFTIYIAGTIGLVLLFCLNKLLSNIRKEEVFTFENVKLLRTISWCCFIVAAILSFSGYYYILFLLGAVAAGFFGLILRVVKNVIEQAVIIKTENDFTI